MSMHHIPSGLPDKQTLLPIPSHRDDPSQQQQRSFHASTLLPSVLTPISPSITSSIPSTTQAPTAYTTHSSPHSQADIDTLVRQNVQLQEDNEFLKQYVNRCENELRVYQTKFPELISSVQQQSPTAENGTPSEELPPWLSQSRYTSPLLLAYEQRIAELQATNTIQQQELSTLQQETDKLLQRNQQIEQELEHNIQQLLQHIDTQQPANGDKNRSMVIDTADQDELEEQLTLYREHIDILKANEHELRVELQNARSMYDRKLDELSTVHNKQIVGSKKEVLNLTKRIEQLTKVEKQCAEYKTELSALRQTTNQQSVHLLELRAKLETSEKLIETHVAKEQALKNELELSHHELENTVKTLAAVEQSLNNYKAKELQMMKQMNDNIERTHQYELQRDAAVVKQAAIQRENDRLTEKLTEQANELRKQHDEQLAGVYKQSKEQEGKLLQELKQMELTCIEMEGLRDGTQRQLTLVREQTGRHIKQLKQEVDTNRHELHQLHKQHHEAQQITQHATDELQRSINERNRQSELWQREREMLNKQANDSKHKLEALDNKFQHTYDQLQTLQAAHDTQTAEFNSSRKSAEATILRLEQQVTQLDTQRHSEVTALRLQLSEAEKQHDSSESAMASLVSQHEKLLAKYREENRANFTHYQKVLSEYKDKHIKLQSLYAVAENRMEELNKAKDHAVHAMLSAEHTIQSLQAALQDSATQNHHLQAQIQHVNHQLSEAQEELAQVQTRCERHEREIARLHRQSEQLLKKQSFVAQLAGQLPQPDKYLARLYNNNMSVQMSPSPSPLEDIDSIPTKVVTA